MNVLPRHIWEIVSRVPLDVGADSGKQINSPCGKKRKNPSTGLSTAESDPKPNPHFGGFTLAHPDMGVAFLARMKGLGDFSTRNGTYPQIRAGYPQNTCLNKRSGCRNLPKCACCDARSPTLSPIQTRVQARPGLGEGRSHIRPEMPPP